MCIRDRDEGQASFYLSGAIIMRAATFAIPLAGLISISSAAVVSVSWSATQSWTWPKAATHHSSSIVASTQASSSSSSQAMPTVAVVSNGTSEAALSSMVNSAYDASVAAARAYTSTHSAGSLTSTISPSATPAQTFTVNKPMQQCVDRLDDTLPAFTPPGFTFSGNIRRY